MLWRLSVRVAGMETMVADVLWEIGRQLPADDTITQASETEDTARAPVMQNRTKTPCTKCRGGGHIHPLSRVKKRAQNLAIHGIHKRHSDQTPSAACLMQLCLSPREILSHSPLCGKETQLSGEWYITPGLEGLIQIKGILDNPPN